MARKRALKKRADYRKGGVVSRKRLHAGSSSDYFDVHPSHRGTNPHDSEDDTGTGDTGTGDTGTDNPTTPPPRTLDGRTTTVSRPGINPVTGEFDEAVFTDVEIEGGVDAPQAATTEDIDTAGTTTTPQDVEKITDRTPLVGPKGINTTGITPSTGATTQASAQDEVTASTFTGGAAGDLDSTVAATSDVTREAAASAAALTATQAAQITDADADKALAKDITGVLSNEATFEGLDGTKVRQEDVTKAEAEIRTGQEITTAELESLKALAQERGINLKELPEYIKASARTAQTGTAATGEGRLMKATAAEEAAKAQYYGADYTPQANN
jgi:hypothetical protein